MPHGSAQWPTRTCYLHSYVRYENARKPDACSHKHPLLCDPARPNATARLFVAEPFPNVASPEPHEDSGLGLCTHNSTAFISKYIRSRKGECEGMWG